MRSNSRLGRRAREKLRFPWGLLETAPLRIHQTLYILAKTRRHSTLIQPSLLNGVVAILSTSWSPSRIRALGSAKRTKPNFSKDSGRQHQKRRKSTAGPDLAWSSLASVSILRLFAKLC